MLLTLSHDLKAFWSKHGQCKQDYICIVNCSLFFSEADRQGQVALWYKTNMLLNEFHAATRNITSRGKIQTNGLRITKEFRFQGSIEPLGHCTAGLNCCHCFSQCLFLQLYNVILMVCLVPNSISWGYKRVFEEYTQALYQRYPDIRIEGENYLPMPIYR